jgi:ABC-type Mn2+/Zn2+ transport system ATPase subunit
VANGLLTLERVSLGYGRRTVLADVDLSIEAGGYVGVVGPNGAGKSTLLLGLLGALPPKSGTRRVRPGLSIGYVPQQDVLDPIFPLSVQDVVAMGFDFAGRPREPKAVGDMLARTGLAGLAARRYRELSGGQKQRALLARALVVGPDILVLDEPTNGLDLPSEQAIMRIVGELHAQGTTIVLVTHVLNLVARYAQVLALVSDLHVTVGPAQELMTGARLTAAYGVAVRVIQVDGFPQVLPGDAA